MKNRSAHDAHESDAARELQALRLELIRPVVTVRGVSALLREVDPAILTRLPDRVRPEEFEHLLTWLEQAGLDLQAVLDRLALTVNEN